MNTKSCCFCFSLKTGVWLIGILQITALIGTVYNGLVRWTSVVDLITTVITTSIFCVLFLDMMLNPDHDPLRLRNFVWVSYLVGVIVIQAVVATMGVLGIGFDITTPFCR